MTAWLDIAQKIASVAAVVFGIGLIVLWRAYLQEIAYSKQRAAHMLTVVLNLTNLIVETQVVQRGKERAEPDMAA